MRKIKSTESRTDNSIKNAKYALIGQIMGIIVSFISRKIFIVSLSAEYLGVNGLFGNILTMLGLAEMGFGTAITFCLYEPIAKKDV